MRQRFVLSPTLFLLNLAYVILNGPLPPLRAASAVEVLRPSGALPARLVQDIENRNDERKQLRALKDQQGAAFSEALDNYGKTFRILDAPTTFPK